VIVLLLALLTATPPVPQSGTAPQTRSQKLTAAAEKLLEFEKKIAAESDEGLDDVLYGDVLNLLDVAVDADPDNIHARALRAPLLLHLAYDGEAYDVCYLVDAKADATLVVARGAKAKPVDVTRSRAVLRNIEKIPASAIPDPPSVCDEEDDRQRGTRTKSL
jgi:alkyl sulfatase BDS1-like metallo-beta-lactamase superfamily hydrolase